IVELVKGCVFSSSPTLDSNRSIPEAAWKTAATEAALTDALRTDGLASGGAGLNDGGDLLRGVRFGGGTSAPEEAWPRVAGPPSPAAFARMARVSLIFLEIAAFADVVVPHGVGVRTTGVSAFRLVFAFCESPTAGDFRLPKPTSKSDRRITFAIFLPKT
ncbi:MAG: hypothetical protein ACKPKO_11175, partial [Candidatus Fonsibacter sp.]